MQGLTIIVAGADPGRFHAALSIATSAAALGRPVRMFLQSEAVTLLRPPLRTQGDGDYEAAGIPGIRDMLAEALAMAVTMTLCQSGLALAGMHADELPPGIATGGLVKLLSDGADDQLLAV
jgi:predicted peroxiredoxin